MSVTPQQVIEAARTWVGVPFMHQGRSRFGVDCVGLVICVSRSLGLVAYDFERTDYGRLALTSELADKLQQYCTRLEAPAPGCVVGVRWQRTLAHLAIYTGDTLIHAYERRGRVIEHGCRAKWPARIDSSWALPGVIYG